MSKQIIKKDGDLVHKIVNAKPNVIKHYWEFTKINADLEVVLLFFFTTDFMFDEETIQLCDHEYEYNLVLFKDDDKIQEMSCYFIEYEKLPQDIKDMFIDYIVRKESK